MDASIGIYLVLIFGALIALGVPIAISIGVSSVIILISTMPFTVAVSTAGQKMVTGIDSFSLLAVPLFILAGNIMNHGGIANRLIRFAYIFVGRIPGAVSGISLIDDTSMVVGVFRKSLPGSELRRLGREASGQKQDTDCRKESP